MALVRIFIGGLSVAGLFPLVNGPIRAAVRYPLSLTLDARLTAGVTTVTSQVTIRVNRPMADVSRTGVHAALNHGGYPNFLNALRTLPAIGEIETQSARATIRYAREDQEAATSRLVLVADTPLFFLSTDPAKARAGYHLTVVDLRFDEQGSVTGQMAGAARVKPAPDGSVVLDDYTESLVQLTGKVTQP
jgi:hypothetical protein